MNPALGLKHSLHSKQIRSNPCWLVSITDLTTNHMFSTKQYCLIVLLNLQFLKSGDWTKIFFHLLLSRKQDAEQQLEVTASVPVK